jgi:hypothetical protein
MVARSKKPVHPSARHSAIGPRRCLVVWIPEDMKVQLDIEVAKQRTSLTQLVTDLISEYLTQRALESSASTGTNGVH